MSDRFDFAVIGAGSSGLVAAEFAAQIGAKVVLIEKARIGGDCTWTGCVPSKALLHVSRIVSMAREAQVFGLPTIPGRVDMPSVRRAVRQAIETVYARESPDVLRTKGITVLTEGAEFINERTLLVGNRRIQTDKSLICTGAHAAVPTIPGLSDVPYFTYETLFDNDRLPERLIVLGAGPVGMEMALAHARLGVAVTVLGTTVLPREEPDVQRVIVESFVQHHIRVLRDTVRRVKQQGDTILVETEQTTLSGDALLVATGRKPNVQGLGLDRAGIAYHADGIVVDENLSTNVAGIFAAGDVTGGPQFTHLAGWQGFVATRNALLPGTKSARATVPRVTFLDPEIAQVGLSEAEARTRFNAKAAVHEWSMDQTDRAICERDTRGFVKLVTKTNGKVLGATVVASRAGEMISQLALAVERGLKLSHLADTIHPYPTWSTPLQQLASDAEVARFRKSTLGRIVLGISRRGT